jgi:hypothetical protein
MAASAMGRWVASAAINKLVETVCSYAGDQYVQTNKSINQWTNQQATVHMVHHVKIIQIEQAGVQERKKHPPI